MKNSKIKNIRLKVIILFLAFSLIIPISYASDPLIDDVLDIGAEEYEAYQIQSHGDTLEINITANNSVNVVIFEEEEFSDYDDGKEYENLTEVRDIKEKNFSIELPRGLFWLSIENPNPIPTEVSIEVRIVTEEETPGFTILTLITATSTVIFYNKFINKRTDLL